MCLQVVAGMRCSGPPMVVPMAHGDSSIDGCSLTLTGTTFHHNRATLSAGMHLACSGPACSLEVQGCKFYNNDMESQLLTAPNVSPFLGFQAVSGQPKWAHRSMVLHAD